MYQELLKTGSLDNAIREFSFVLNGERMCDFLALFVLV